MRKQGRTWYSSVQEEENSRYCSMEEEELSRWGKGSTWYSTVDGGITEQSIHHVQIAMECVVVYFYFLANHILGCNSIFLRCTFEVLWNVLSKMIKGLFTLNSRLVALIHTDNVKTRSICDILESVLPTTTTMETVVTLSRKRNLVVTCKG